MENSIFVLTESVDDCICRMWYFQVKNEIEMAELIINNLENLGEMRGMSCKSGLESWIKGQIRTPESLLSAIMNTSIDGDSESGFEIHKIDLKKKYGLTQECFYEEEE